MKVTGGRIHYWCPLFIGRGKATARSSSPTVKNKGKSITYQGFSSTNSMEGIFFASILEYFVSGAQSFFGPFKFSPSRGFFWGVLESYAKSSPLSWSKAIINFDRGLFAATKPVKRFTKRIFSTLGVSTSAFRLVMYSIGGTIVLFSQRFHLYLFPRRNPSCESSIRKGFLVSFRLGPAISNISFYCFSAVF